MDKGKNHTKIYDKNKQNAKAAITYLRLCLASLSSQFLNIT